MERCPCGSGLDTIECCYVRFPGVAYAPDSRSSSDFYARWSISRNRLWRAMLAHSGRAAPGRVVILGAGTCRDLPMDYICATFTEVVLVDVNPQALADARVHLPAECAQKIVRVCWDINGQFGHRLDALLGELRTAGRSIGEAIQALSRNTGALGSPVLPPELAERAPFDLVLSDLVMTQLALHYAYELSLIMGQPVSALLGLLKAELTVLADLLGQNHLRLLQRLSGPQSVIMVLNDTFMLGRNPDGSESLFNLVAGASARDAGDDSWIRPDGIASWMADYSLLGSDLGRLLQGPEWCRTWVVLDKSWWWWPHCAMKSYLVICYVLEQARDARLCPLRP